MKNGVATMRAPVMMFGAFQLLCFTGSSGLGVGVSVIDALLSPGQLPGIFIVVTLDFFETGLMRGNRVVVA